MFSSYDMQHFGVYIRKIRKHLNLTQRDVRELSGISEDTLTNLEKGLVIPKYETLELLSYVYKIELLKVFIHFKKEKNLLFWYNKLDEYIVNNDLKGIKKIYSNLLELKDEVPIDKLVKISDLEMLITYSSANIDYYEKNNFVTKVKAKESLIEALTKNISGFSIFKFDKYNYNFLELRLLLLVALFDSEFKDYESSNKIIEFAIKKLDGFDGYNIIPAKFKLILYFNLSYNYHNLNDHKMAYTYADKGIKLGQKEKNIADLFFLYYRKGIAEYHLKDDNYYSTLKKAINILDILEKYDLLKTYKDITYKKYNIEL